MRPLEHSAILLTCIRLPFVIKIFVLVYFREAVLYRLYCIVILLWAVFLNQINMSCLPSSRHILDMMHKPVKFHEMLYMF